MMSYTVKYKRVGLFSRWKTIKNVTGDLCYKDDIQTSDGLQPFAGYPCRIFLLEDQTRIEIPLLNHIFIFSKERWMLIKQRMEQETGQDIKTIAR